VKLLPFLLRGAAFAAGLTFAFGAEPTPAAAVAPTITVRRDLAYDAHPRQKLDLYLPGGKARRARPAIAYFHGGGWRSGSRADGEAFGRRYAALGFVVACVDVRYSSDAGFPAQLEDAKAAIRWLRGQAERYRIDPEHVGAYGEFTGGHLAALLGAMNSTELYESGAALDQPSRVQSVVDLAGPVDLVALHESGQPVGDPVADEIRLLLGAEPRRVPVPAGASDPTKFADVQSPPFLIVHGDQDRIVPVEQSRRLYEALVLRHVSVHLHIIRGAGHLGPAFAAPEITAIIDHFLAETLNKGTQPPDLNPTELTESLAAPN
jgi:acetyl esterase/lipase